MDCYIRYFKSKKNMFRSLESSLVLKAPTVQWLLKSYNLEKSWKKIFPEKQEKKLL